MMSLVPYRNSLFSDFDRLFSDAFSNGGSCRLPALGRESRWNPAIDVKEEEDKYVIKADVPGVEPKEIEVTLEDGVLSISGERSDEKKEDCDGYCRVERMSGSFTRRLMLPDSVDADKIKAKGKNGVLVIEIPKKERVKPQKIAIQ